MTNSLYFTSNLGNIIFIKPRYAFNLPIFCKSTSELLNFPKPFFCNSLMPPKSIWQIYLGQYQKVTGVMSISPSRTFNNLAFSSTPSAHSSPAIV